MFTLRASRYPLSIPVSLASLSLVQGAATDFAYTAYGIIRRTRSISDQLETVRKIYEVADVPNTVVDGTVEYRRDGARKGCPGITLEFKYVSLTLTFTGCSLWLIPIM